MRYTAEESSDRYPMYLPADKQRALRRRMLKGQNRRNVTVPGVPEKFSPAEALVATNLRLVHSICKFLCPEFDSMKEENADLFSAGLVGLEMAIERWNPESARLSTYSPFWIKLTKRTGQFSGWPFSLRVRMVAGHEFDG